MQLREAFVKAIKENEGILFKISKIYGKDLEDQKDLYQEIVYQSWRSFPQFKQEAKFSTWLYRIGLNTSISFINKQKKRVGESGLDAELSKLIEEKEYLLEERSALLYDSIKKLNTVDRGLVFLYLENKSYEEMASITGMSSTNVGTKLNRIKLKLKEIMLNGK